MGWVCLKFTDFRSEVYLISRDSLLQYASFRHELWDYQTFFFFGKEADSLLFLFLFPKARINLFLPLRNNDFVFKILLK